MSDKAQFQAVPQPFTASSFAQYADGVGTVRASGGDLGGGSETLLTQPQPFRKSKRAQSTEDDETWVEGQVSNTLNNFDLGDTRTTHAVVHCSDTAPTVTSSGPPYSRTGNERVEAEAVVAVQGTIIGRGENAGPQGTGATEGGPMFTLTKADIHGVATPPPAMAVRRLTPVECERLQGFPDNWSRIPWKGKPETDCPDGPRYKACGNSMAVPVMRWIGERIAAADASCKANEQAS